MLHTMNPSSSLPSATPHTEPASSSSQQPSKLKWRQSSRARSFDPPFYDISDSRICFPPPLPELPIQQFPIHLTEIAVTDQQLKIWKSCRDEARSIVSEESLDSAEIAIYSRKGAGEDERESPTLLISLKTELEEDVAKSALLTIAYMMHEKGVRDLRVEIVGVDPSLEEKMFRINLDHVLVKLWPRKVKALVLDALEFVEFSAVSVKKYGYSQQTAVPTIIVIVKDERYDLREELKEAVVRICAENGAPGMRVAVIW